LLQTVRLDVDGRALKGEFLRSANIVNTMIKQLSVFTSEVTRVAREVGTDGKLGGQAQVPGVAGTVVPARSIWTSPVSEVIEPAAVACAIARFAANSVNATTKATTRCKTLLLFMKSIFGALIAACTAHVNGL
jgi:hypothetical protein